MDHPTVEASAHAHALRSLNRANRLFGLNRNLHAGLKELGAADLSVLDVGCGGGGFLGHVAGRSASRRPGLLIGLDRSEFALQCARTWHGRVAQYAATDARRLPFSDNSIDVVTCSLFLHHFDDPEAIVILHEAARVCRRGVVVADLARSWPAWVLTWLATRIVSRSWIFHVDGPRSVRAAFRASELADLAQQAGLAGARVECRFPFRLQLIWRKGEGAGEP